MIFHINGFTLSLILKQRLGATRKWPIVLKAILRLRSFPGSFLLVPTEQERPLRTRLSPYLDGVLSIVQWVCLSPMGKFDTTPSKSEV